MATATLPSTISRPARYSNNTMLSDAQGAMILSLIAELNILFRAVLSADGHFLAVLADPTSCVYDWNSGTTYEFGVLRLFPPRFNSC